MEKVVIGNATLYHGDCMELMASLDDKSFDLAIVDPPYGIGNFVMTDSPSRWNEKWNEKIPNHQYFEELKRVSKNQIVWGANYYNCFSSNGGAIVWYKSVRHPNMSKCEIASTTFHKKVEYVDIVWQNINRPTSPIHPCEKPINLYEWLLTNYAKLGDTILDTHLGSGSSAIAANKLGFNFTGIELDRDYFDAACARIEKSYNQPDMFAPDLPAGKPEQDNLFV
jgi:site-specific DNA-methyltransferase (adenine-specific)